MNQLVCGDGLNVVRVDRGAMIEYFLSGQAAGWSDSRSLFAEYLQFLESNQAQLVNIRICVSPAVQADLFADMDAIQKQLDCPITWLNQSNNAFGLTLHGHAVSGVNVSSVESNGQIVGRTFQDACARYYHLSLVPENTDIDNNAQTRELYDQMDSVLRSVGLDFSATVRTWLFADRILNWYEALNNTRDAFFTEHTIFNKVVPAGTGIGLGNPYGAAIVAEAFAIQQLDDQVAVSKITSPMQCEALDYKSSFSRATVVTTPDHRRMYVSGTASIAPGGETVHLSDTAKQIELTMQVADALIRNGGLNWDDTVRAIAYFKHRRDFGLLDNYLRPAGILLPHVKIEADVCRDDLLFEIELDLLAKANIA